MFSNGAPKFMLSDNNKSPTFRLILWMMLGQWLVCTFIGLRYTAYTAFPNDFIGQIYFITSLISHFALLTLLENVILIWPFTLIFSLSKWPIYWSCIVDAFSFFLLFADTFVYQEYRFHINEFVIHMFFAGQVIKFDNSFVLIITAAAGVAICISILNYIFIRKIFIKLKKGFLLISVNVIFMIVSHLIFAWSTAKDYISVTQQRSSFPFYFPMTADKLMIRLGVTSEEDFNKRKIKINMGTNDFNYPLSNFSCNKNEPLNIIVILIDTLRYDMLNHVNMPNINDFANKNWNFTQHYSGGNATRAGVFSLFYSLPPNYWSAALSARKSPVFIDELQRQNYQIGIFSSAQLSSPEFDKTIFSSIPNLRTHTDGETSSDRDKNITKEWLRWLGEIDEKKPFFGFLFYDAVHGYDFPSTYSAPFKPYWEKINYLELTPKFNKTPYLNRYKNAVHFVDSEIKKILDNIKIKEKFSNTVIIITSDHGEEFNDNQLNYWGHNGNYTNYQTHVPFVISWPGKGVGERVNMTSHYDVVPTLMSMALGCNEPTSNYSIGNNIFNFNDENKVIMGGYSENALFKKNIITVVDGYGRLSAYDNNYRPLHNSQIQNEDALYLMELMSKFYKK